MADTNLSSKSRNLETATIPWERLDRKYADCQTSSEVIRETFNMMKKRSKNYSLQFVCKRSGILSRGYLSAVMAGKRRISLKYRDPLCETFKLTGLRADFFKTYIDHDHARPEVKSFFKKRLDELRKYLLTHPKSMPKKVPHHFLTHLVSGAFGALGYRATPQEIHRILSDFEYSAIEISIKNLIAWGLVLKDGEHFVYHTDKEKETYIGEPDDRTQLALFEDSMAFAMKQVAGHWFEIQEKVAVLTDTFAVKQEVYLENIDRLRKMLFNFKDELKAGEGDTVVLFNVQLGPVYPSNAFKRNDVTT